MSSKMQAGGGRWPPKKQEVGDEGSGAVGPSYYSTVLLAQFKTCHTGPGCYDSCPMHTREGSLVLIDTFIC